MVTKKLKVVTIGGGSGQFILLSSIRDISNIQITSIVSMVDNGGSTGRLRDEMGILPPGDIFKCILALSPDRDVTRKFLLTRFQKVERLKGHNAGNLLLTFLSQYAGSFPEGVTSLAEILRVEGDILPVTLDKATLVAELTDGSRIFGEVAIDIPRGNQREKITQTYLVPHHAESVKIYPPAAGAIKNADYIIIGPGDLFTSIIPNLIVPGIIDSFKESSAKIIYNLNIMTKFGETDQYNPIDFVEEVEKHIGKQIDIIIANQKKPKSEILRKYVNEKSSFVKFESQNDLEPRNTILVDIIDESGGIIRHDSKKFSKVLDEVFKDVL